jgi:hypothetical protein
VKVLRRAFGIVREQRRAYVALNAMAYGLLAVGLVVGALFPALNAGLTGSMDDGGTTDLVVSLLERPWLFAATILVVNVVRVVLASILLPSMVVPFAGIVVFAHFAVTTGITLAPVDHATTMTLIPHSLTMVIEFQAYVLLLLGAYVLGRSWLRPATIGAETRRGGYVRALREIGVLAVPAAVLFVVGAVYEALSLTYLLPLLFR